MSQLSPVVSERDITDTVDVLASRFAVHCRRTNGERRVYQRYDDRAVAEGVASRLREVGCPAEVIDVSMAAETQR